jgi:hypothetical protein
MAFAVPECVPWTLAEDLASALTAGAALPVIPSPVLLESGEVLHAQLPLVGWRFHGIDVEYERRRTPMTSRPLMYGLAMAATSIGNRRTRAAAEQLAAPQWRPLGPLRTMVTDRRLVVLHEGAWASVWYAGICQVVPRLDDERIELIFEADPPYALCGEWTPYLAVLLTAVLAATYGIPAVSQVLSAS